MLSGTSSSTATALALRTRAALVPEPVEKTAWFASVMSGVEAWTVSARAARAAAAKSAASPLSSQIVSQSSGGGASVPPSPRAVAVRV